jgi:hypothetical protein
VATHLPAYFVEHEFNPETRSLVGGYWYMAPCGVCGPRGPWMAPVGEIPTCPTCSVERDRILEAGGEPDIPTAASVEFVTAAASSRPT